MQLTINDAWKLICSGVVLFQQMDEHPLTGKFDVKSH
jgi:hypothetical protein